MWRWRALLPLALFAAPVFAQDSDQEVKDEEKDKKKHPGFRFVFKKHPSLRFDDWLRVDFRARLQMDWSSFDPPVKKFQEIFDIPRHRLGIEGNFLHYFEYELSREVGEADFQWKDMYVNFRPMRSVQIRGGRFRIPFSMDQLTGPTHLDFIERSRIADRLAPNRDTGVMLHGSLFEQGVKYQFGYFFNDGDNAADRNNDRTGARTFAARLTGRPLDPLPLPALLKGITLGAAATNSVLPEGLWSLRGRTVSSKETFFPYYFVKGYRNRYGTELAWMPGPFSLKAEYITVTEQRKGQGLAGEDVPDLIDRGWYVAGTWVVTGQRKVRGLDRGKFIPLVQGLGAIELTTRAEALRYFSDGGVGRPSRSVRASNILGNSDRVWTFGVNWYANQWTKVLANFMREKIEDSFRAPVQGQNLFWTFKLRLQLSL